MPFRTIPGSDTQYGLICFGADGAERCDDPDGRDGLMSARLPEIAAQDVTNVFLFSHGWMGDIPAALDQYDRWIEAFISSQSDLQRARNVFPGFRPLFIGLHWPSLPWGNEEIGDRSFAAEDECFGPDELHRSYVERLGDTHEIRVALETICDEARRDAAPEQLSGRARQAFLDLNHALSLGSDGPAGPPDADREPFDPDAALEAGNEVDFSGAGEVFRGVLGVLRLCSYWTMKKRARTVGEHGMHAFVNDLQRATAARKVRVHLMGHSFGAIVVSSMLGGPQCDGPLERPIDSVVLAQGAVSLWSYAESIPYEGAGEGYFHDVIAQRKIRGPLVTTRSRYDVAVGVQYPKACLPGEIAFEAEYPKYGAVGTFGFQGLSGEIKVDSPMLAADGEYGFEPGKIHNLEASQFICKGGGSSGAHSDIAGSEVAHAIWQAAFASL